MSFPPALQVLNTKDLEFNFVKVNWILLAFYIFSYLKNFACSGIEFNNHDVRAKNKSQKCAPKWKHLNAYIVLLSFLFFQHFLTFIVDSSSFWFNKRIFCFSFFNRFLTSYVILMIYMLVPMTYLRDLVRMRSTYLLTNCSLNEMMWSLRFDDVIVT